MSWTHHDIQIELLPGTGRFRATIDGKIETADSLSAMKKRIDKHRADAGAFQPFDAITVRHYVAAGPILEWRVVGTKVEGRGPGRRAMFKVEPRGKNKNRADTEYAVLRDTPENRVLLQAFMDASEAEERIVAEARAASRAAGKAVPWEKPTNDI